MGGIKEVLPSDVIHLAEPNEECLVEVLINVITSIKDGRVLPKMEIHQKVAPLYTWSKVKNKNIYCSGSQLHGLWSSGPLQQ